MTERCNLKLNHNKCKLQQTQVKYLGHIVSENGTEPDPKRLDWPKPKNSEGIHQFTTFAGYYRKVCKGLFKRCKAFNRITSKYLLQEVRCHKSYQWGKEQENTFEASKQALSSPPVLAYANYDLPFEVIDAGQKGLDAVLYQKQDGKLRLISFNSRCLKRLENNYPASKLEF